VRCALSILRRIYESAVENLKLTTSFVTTFVFAVTVVCVLVAWRDARVLVWALVGTALGWAVGILLAPYPEEQKRFQQLSKGIAGFVTGFVAGKLDRIFDLLVDKKEGDPVILHSRFVRGFGIALSCFLVTTITVFVARTYWEAVKAKNAKS
jgi:hypothetical protein